MDNLAMHEVLEILKGLMPDYDRRNPPESFADMARAKGLAEGLAIGLTKSDVEALADGESTALARGLAKGLALGCAIGRAKERSETLDELRARAAERARGRFGESVAACARASLARVTQVEFLLEAHHWAASCDSASALLKRLDPI